MGNYWSAFYTSVLTKSSVAKLLELVSGLATKNLNQGRLCKNCVELWADFFSLLLCIWNTYWVASCFLLTWNKRENERKRWGWSFFFFLKKWLWHFGLHKPGMTHTRTQRMSKRLKSKSEFQNSFQLPVVQPQHLETNSSPKRAQYCNWIWQIIIFISLQTIVCVICCRITEGFVHVCFTYAVRRVLCCRESKNVATHGNGSLLLPSHPTSHLWTTATRSMPLGGRVEAFFHSRLLLLLIFLLHPPLST